MDELEQRAFGRDVLIILTALTLLFLSPVFFKLGFYGIHYFVPQVPVWIAQLAYWKTMLVIILVRFAFGITNGGKGRK